MSPEGELIMALYFAGGFMFLGFIVGKLYYDKTEVKESL